MTIITLHIIASAVLVLLVVFLWPTKERAVCPDHGDEDEHDAEACAICRKAAR